jgi:hypothetical protein
MRSLMAHSYEQSRPTLGDISAPDLGVTRYKTYTTVSPRDGALSSPGERTSSLTEFTVITPFRRLVVSL